MSTEPMRRGATTGAARFRVGSWGCALLLVACGPALAPLPPRPAGVTLEDEARLAFGPDLPADARLIRVPAWAKLQSVWGTYDPLVSVQVAFRPDGHTMILLGGDGQLWLWDREAREIRGHIDACVVGPEANTGVFSDSARSLIASPDGLAAVGFKSGRYCVVDLATGKSTAKIDSTEPARCQGLTAVSAGLAAGKLVTYAYSLAVSYAMQFGDSYSPPCGGQLRSWDARSGARLTDTTPDGAWTAAISPDGERFAMVPVQGQTILGEVRMLSRTGQVLWVRKLPPKTGVNRMVFASSDVLLATDGDQIFSINSRDGALLGFFEERDPPLPRNLLYPDLNPGMHAEIAVTPDGRHAVTNTASWVTLWDVGARREVARASGQSQDVLRFVGLQGLAPSPDGSMFATPGMVILGTRALEIIDAPRGPLQMLAVSGDAQRAIAQHTARGNGGFEVWDAPGRTLRRWPGVVREHLSYGVSDMALPGDGARAALHASDFVELRDWSSGRQSWVKVGGERDSPVFSPDGRTIATIRWVSGDPPRSWAAMATMLDAATGAVLWQRALKGPRSEALFFGQEGRTVVFYDADDRLVFLDAHDGSVLRHVGPTEPGKWTRAGDTRALVVGEDRSVAAYDLVMGNLVWRTNEGNQNGSPLVVAPIDGRAFFEADDGAVRRRSVESGADLGDPIDLGPSADAPLQLAVSSDGRTLLVGTRRGVLLRFRLTQ